MSTHPRVVALALATLATGCGPPLGDPVSFTPVPRPQVRYESLWAPADHYHMSLPLARMERVQSFDVVVRPDAVLPEPGQFFANAVTLWLMATPTVPEQVVDREIALSFAYVHGASEGTWAVRSFLAGRGWAATEVQVQIPFGAEKTVRIVRRVDDVAEFLVDGVSVLTLHDPEPVRYVRGMAVGSQVLLTYSFAPRFPVLGTSLRSPTPACGPCPSGP